MSGRSPEEPDMLVDVVLEDNVSIAMKLVLRRYPAWAGSHSSANQVLFANGAHYGDNLCTAVVTSETQRASVRVSGNVCTPTCDEVCSVHQSPDSAHGLAAGATCGKPREGRRTVEAGHHATGQLDVANTRTEGASGHCRNRGEAGVTVGAVVLDGVHVSSVISSRASAQVGGTRPPFTACVNVACTLGGVRHDGAEGVHGIIVDCLLRGGTFQQETANVGVFNAGGSSVPTRMIIAGQPHGLVLGAVGPTEVGFANEVKRRTKT